VASYYSNQYSSQVAATEPERGHSVGPNGLVHDAASNRFPSARRAQDRIDVATFTLTSAQLLQNNIRIFKVRSGARIRDLKVSSPGTGETGTFNRGVGAVFGGGRTVGYDLLLFTTQLALTGAKEDLSIFTESGTLDDADRGKPLWALRLKGQFTNGIYSEDPGETWNIFMVPQGTIATDAPTDFVFTLIYSYGE